MISVLRERGESGVKLPAKIVDSYGHQGGIFPGIWGYNLPQNLGGSHKILQEMHVFFVAF